MHCEHFSCNFMRFREKYSFGCPFNLSTNGSSETIYCSACFPKMPYTSIRLSEITAKLKGLLNKKFIKFIYDDKFLFVLVGI